MIGHGSHFRAKCANVLRRGSDHRANHWPCVTAIHGGSLFESLAGNSELVTF